MAKKDKQAGKAKKGDKPKKGKKGDAPKKGKKGKKSGAPEGELERGRAVLLIPADAPAPAPPTPLPAELTAQPEQGKRKKDKPKKDAKGKTKKEKRKRKKPEKLVTAQKTKAESTSKSDEVLNVSAAPKPVGAYPHARRVGELLFLSGVGPRQPGTDAIPGGPIEDPTGLKRPYDAAAQTRATIENVKTILEGCGSKLEDVVDVTAFLVDMKRDFAAYNAVYKEYFEGIQATRTTLQIGALPTPIAVELKVIARPS